MWGEVRRGEVMRRREAVCQWVGEDKQEAVAIRNTRVGFRSCRPGRAAVLSQPQKDRTRAETRPIPFGRDAMGALVSPRS